MNSDEEEQLTVEELDGMIERAEVYLDSLKKRRIAKIAKDRTDGKT